MAHKDGKIVVAQVGVGQWGKILFDELKKLARVKYASDSKSDLASIFNDPEVRAVFIATPTPTHFNIASKALDSGKHVFLEKPGTDDYRKLEKLVSKARNSNLILAIGYEYLHHPAVQKIRNITHGKQIQFARLEYQKWGPFQNSIITNLLCHDISILKYLGIDTNKPQINKVSIVTEADILITRFGSNALSVINRVNPLKQRTTLIKADKESYLWSGNDLFEIIGEKMQKIEIPHTSPLAAEINDFLASITNKHEPLSNGEFALEVYKVIEQVEALR